MSYLYNNKKLLESTVLFFLVYALFLIIITSGFTNIPSEQIIVLGCVLALSITLLYVLPISLHSYVLSLTGIKHDVKADGCLDILEDVPEDSIFAILGRYIYYLILVGAAIFIHPITSGSTQLLFEILISLGGFFAFIELIPTGHNKTRQFAKYHKKVYLLLVLFTGLFFLVILRNYWF